MKKISFRLCACMLAVGSVGVLASCSDSNSPEKTIDDGSNEGNDIAEEYYSGGKLGTVFDATPYAYTLESPASERQGFSQAFKVGELLFEKDFNTNSSGAFKGLGPLYVRRGCLYCHPSYGHGKRQEGNYKSSQMGNGYLLVIYDKQTNGYLTSLTGMPQTQAVEPFKSPIKESEIMINWPHFTDEWNNTFPDGETYDLIYPEVTIPQSAYYVPLESARGEIPYEDVAIRLESTIGIYGTGLLDAISDDSITAQWKKESPYLTLNPALWDAEANTWKSYYNTGLDKKSYVRKFTYALSRGPLQDGPGANAIWNITNVTRSDRKYNYMTATYAKVASKDPDVQAKFYEYFPEEKTNKGVEYDIYRYLTGKEDGKNIAKAEMSDADYKNLMVWHRGLAVPAARNVESEEFKLGKKLFNQIGCAQCHRPTWTTGKDEIKDPNGMLTNKDLPRYPNQKIWPYSDMVQHRLFMKNDIRTGWCRTTPLWGRGLSYLCTGASDRLHDCRARTVIEAIMWHATNVGGTSDAYESVKKFRNLSKSERDAIVKFVESI